MPHLKLLDVDDVFALVHGVVRRSRLELRWDEREDLVAYLVAEAWKLSLRFDPSLPKGTRNDFAGYLTINLKQRIYDWQRQRNGRTVWRFADRVYERPPRPELVSLDNSDDHDLLDGALGTGPGAPTDGWSPDLGRLLGARDRQRDRDADTLGLAGAGRAAG